MLSVVVDAPVLPSLAVPDNAEKLSQFCGAVKFAGIVQFKFPSPVLKIRSACGGGAGPPCQARKTNASWLSRKAVWEERTATVTGTTTDAPLPESRTDHGLI